MIPTWVATCSISASRWLDTSTVVPSAASDRTRCRTSRVPCGSSPLVGSSRMSRSRGCSSAAASPSRCFMPSEYWRYFFLAAAVRPTRCRASSMRRSRVRGSAVASHASRRRRLSRPDRYGWNAGPSISAPTRGSTCRARPGHRLAEQLDLTAVRGDEPEQHPDGRGLAGPVRAEEAVHRPAWDVQADPVDRRDAAEPSGQLGGGDAGGQCRGRHSGLPVLRDLLQRGRGDGADVHLPVVGEQHRDQRGRQEPSARHRREGVHQGGQRRRGPAAAEGGARRR